LLIYINFIILLNPTCHMMHHQFNIQHSNLQSQA